MPDILHHDTDDMPWTCAAARGVSYKSLRYDADSGAGAVLLHMCPSTPYPPARMHAGAEILVLDGDLELGGRRLGRGAYAFLPSQTESSPFSAGGCVLYVTYPGRVEGLDT